MSWKYVFDTGNLEPETHIDASIIAGKAGYQFFLYKGTVYFRDEAGCRTFETRISEKDLF